MIMAKMEKLGQKHYSSKHKKVEKKIVYYETSEYRWPFNKLQLFFNYILKLLNH